MDDLLRRGRRILRGRVHAWLHALQPGVPAEAPDERLAADPIPNETPETRARRRACGVLEVDPAATPREVRSAYRRLCRRYHPDRFADDEAKAKAANELLAEINRAYELLGGG